MSIKKLWSFYKLRSQFMKLLKSTTTQNVTIAAGTVVGIIALVRNIFPAIVFWPESMDTEIEALIITLIVPLIARVIAMFRNPEKFQK